MFACKKLALFIISQLLNPVFNKNVFFLVNLISISLHFRLNKLKVPKLEEKPEILEPTPSPVVEIPKKKEASPTVELINPVKEPVKQPVPVEIISEKSATAEVVIPDDEEIMDETMEVVEPPIIPSTIKTLQATIDAIDTIDEEPIKESTPVPSRKASTETEPSERIQPPIIPVRYFLKLEFVGFSILTSQSLIARKK